MAIVHQTTSEATRDFLSRLELVKKNGNGWIARCPAHDDRTPSLSISQGRDGRVLLKCFAGCTTEQICAALRITEADLFVHDDDRPGRRHGTRTAPVRSVPVDPSGPDRRFSTAGEAVGALSLRGGKIVGRWCYHRAGEHVGTVVRVAGVDGRKSFRQVSLNGEGWIPRAMPEPRPLYRCDDIPTAGTVYVVEGERCCDAMVSLGLPTVTWPGGSDATAKADWSPLAERDVVIFPDHDEAGRTAAEKIAATLLEQDATVRIASLWEHHEGLGQGDDIVDLLADVDGDLDRALSIIFAAVDAAPSTELGDPVEPVDLVEMSGPPPCPGKYVPFPCELVPSPIGPYLKEAAAPIGCDPAYVALPMLASIASAIGTTRRLAIKKRWSEPPTIWAAPIGLSGEGKSPAMERGTAAVKRQEAKLWAENEKESEKYRNELAEWHRTSPKERGLKPEKPADKRCRVNDATTPKIFEILHANPRGLLQSVDELSGLFAYLARREGGRQDTAAYNSLYAADSTSVDRIIRGTQYLPLATLAITGTIQPAVAARVLQSEFFDSGLVPRFILAAPPETPARAWTNDEDDPDREAELFEVFDSLYKLKHGVTKVTDEQEEDGQEEDGQNEIAPRLVRMESAAKEAFVAYYERLEKRRAKEPSERFRTAMSKHKSLPARLALGFHFVKVATGEHTDAVVLGAETMKAAIELVEDWVTPETARVYRLLAGQDVDGGESADLLHWIASREVVTARDVYSKGPQKYRNDPGRTRTTLDGLVDDGELTRSPKPGGRTFVYRVPQGVMQ